MDQKQLFRLCHVCGSVNEGQDANEILKCGDCGKGFLPLNYFERLHSQMRQQQNEKEATRILLNPINGLVVFW